MKKIVILTIIIIGLPIFMLAQVSDNFTLNSNDLIISRDGIYDIISIVDNTFTDEIGNPQLPVKIVSYVLPYNSPINFERDLYVFVCN